RMLAYLGRRLLQSVFVLLGVSVIVFGLLHLTGDPTRLLLPLEAREEDVRQLRALLGLDDPLWIQYVRFLSRAVRGDFGLSFKHQVPALTLIAQTLPATLQLTAAGLALALVVAVPAGILAALKRNSVLDAVCSVGVLLGQAMPVYWLGLLLIMVFAVGLGWFPAEPHREDHDEQQPEPVDGHGLAQQDADGTDRIEDGVALQRGQNAGRNGHDEREGEAGGGELQRRGECLRDQRQRRDLVLEGEPEVTANRAAQEAHVLYPQRIVEAEQRAKLPHVLLAGLERQEQSRRIAGEVEEREDDHRDAEQDAQALQQTPGHEAE